MARDLKEIVRVIFVVIVVVIMINAFSEDIPEVAQYGWYILGAFVVGAGVYFGKDFWKNKP